MVNNSRITGRSEVTRVIEFDGHKRTISEWAESIGLNKHSLKDRLRKYPVHEALTMHVRSKWTEEDVDKLVKLYPDHKSSDILKLFDNKFTYNQLRAEALKLKLKKPIEFIRKLRKEYDPIKHRMPLGSTRKSSEGYVYIKTKEGWRLASHVTWGKPIPKGYCICTKDRSKNNVFDINNLEMITIKEMSHKYGGSKYPPEIIRLMKLSSQIRKLTNEK